MLLGLDRCLSIETLKYLETIDNLIKLGYERKSNIIPFHKLLKIFKTSFLLIFFDFFAILIHQDVKKNKQRLKKTVTEKEGVTSFPRYGKSLKKRIKKKENHFP